MDSFDFPQQPRTEAPPASGSSPHRSHAPRREAEATEPAAVAGPSSRFARSLAVVIGIDVYGDGISPLRSAVADAQAIAEALRRDHGFETWCLLDDAAQLPQLLALLHERLPAALGPADRLLLYFAGHGIALDGDAGPAGYLVPARAPRAERDGFLPMHVLHGALARLPVRHALVILDCCFAGTFRWSSLRDVEPAAAKLYRERYDRYIESAAWQVLTSASADQLALDMLANERGEGTGAHSPFALALLDGLAGAADYTQDNLVTADELALYARERVAPAAEAVGHRQIPQLFPLDRHDAGQFVFQVPRRALALAPAPALGEATNPYRGLQSFHEADRALFFGRDAVIQRLVDAVSDRALTVVVGPSGSGKSSLVHAGLVPALRAAGWTVLPSQRPGREPLAALDAWTRALGAEQAPDDPVASWIAAVAARADARPGQPWLVIVDQLEELLTHRTAEAGRLAFLDALARALRAAPRLHLVVTVRSDAEPQLHDTALAPWWSAARFAVPAMTRDELRQSIEQPATAAVLHFAPSRLVERLLDDVALVPAPLPLLSFALSELYRRCWTRWQDGVRDRALREADYDQMGSVARALTQRATAVHDQLVAEDAAYAITIRNVFTRMVAIVGGEVARRRVPRDELVYEDPAENRRVADVLQRFHEARLISLGTEQAVAGGASAYAEPTHDELVRGWTKVSQWLDELDATAGTRALLAALGDAVRSWRAHAQSDSYLWSDPRIDLLSGPGRVRRLVLNASEARFVQRSVRRRRGRRARLIGGLLAVIAVLAVAAGVALRQGRRAEAAAEQASRSAHDANLQRDAAAASAALARQRAAEAKRNEERANQSAEEARRSAERERLARQQAADEATRANQNAEQSRRLLAQAYQEAGRQLLLDGHPQEAMPYLVAARQKGEHSEALRMLLWEAARDLPLTPPLEHQRQVRSAAFSPDGTRVVTASADHTARIWDAATGKPLGSPLQHQWLVVSAAFSSDGRRVVTTSWDQTARVWDTTTGKPLTAPLRHGGSVRSAAFSPDGTRIVTASADKTARLWDAATGKPLAAPLQHQGEVNGAAFSPDGTRVVTASADKTARLWDAATGKPLTAPLEHQGAVDHVAFSPDGTRIVTASADKTARLWDATTGEPLASPLQHKETVNDAAFSPDGTRVVTASFDRTARLWDAATGKPLASPLQHKDSVRRAAFSPDGTRVVTASFDTTARVWDATTGKPLASPLQHQGLVWSAAFSPDGRRVVTASDDRTARVWDAAGNPLVLTIQHQRSVRCAAFSRDGARVVGVSDDNTVHAWNAATGAPLPSPRLHRLTPSVLGCAFSPDGARVVIASHDDTARVWDVATGTPLTPPLQHGDLVWSAAFSPDGTRILTASNDSTARIWDAATGKPLAAPLQHPWTVQVAAASPDGTRVVTAGGDGAARIWDASTGKPLAAPLQHPRAVSSAAFSPDGARIATASEDGTARVWNAATGKLLVLPLQHPRPVISVVFSPDSSRIVTASEDHTTRIWDAVTGKPLAAPLEHQGLVTSVAFSPDGTRVITASADRTVRIWATRIAERQGADWAALAARSPFVLDGSVHVRRARRAREATQGAPR